MIPLTYVKKLSAGHSCSSLRNQCRGRLLTHPGPSPATLLCTASPIQRPWIDCFFPLIK